MFAAFTRENGIRGTFALKSDSLLGPFKPHSEGALTPYDWECLDGTLSENFVHLEPLIRINIESDEAVFGFIALFSIDI